MGHPAGRGHVLGRRRPPTRPRPPPQRPDADYRGYAGQLASGVLHAGDEVVVLPGGQQTRIAAIDTFDGSSPEAAAPLSVTVRLRTTSTSRVAT